MLSPKSLPEISMGEAAREPPGQNLRVGQVHFCKTPTHNE